MSGKDNFLLDTNVILGLLKGHPQINVFLREHSANQLFHVSQITRMELLGYPNISSEEEACLSRFLSLTKILPINDVICDEAIQLRRKTKLKLPDAMIAATAICFNCVLITCDEGLLGNIEKLRSVNPMKERA